MEISLTEQGIVFLFSCVVGGLLGAFYDVFRIIRIAFNSKWLSIFFQDLIFCILSALSVILLVFYTNSGRVRWFSLFGCFLCFVIYHLTVGRFIMFVSKKIIEFIKKVLKFLYKITIIPIKRFYGFLLKTGVSAGNNLYYINQKQKIKKSASKGFGLYKNKSKNNFKITEKDSVKKHKTLKKSKKKT